MGTSKTYSETPRDWIQFSVYDKLILSPVLLLVSFAFTILTWKKMSPSTYPVQNNDLPISAQLIKLGKQ